jgi:GAF domain-containing protein
VTGSGDDDGDEQESPPPPGHRDARAEDLAASLDDLARLITGLLTLEELLGRVAASAARAIPGADGAGVTLLRLDRGGNQIQALAASHPFVVDIDAVQYRLLDEGPCITAAHELRAVVSGSLSGDSRWPRFGPRVGRLGVHSALSLPMVLADNTLVGVLNAYGRTKNAFDDDAARLGELFAAPAAIAVFNAQILADVRTRAAQLQAALVSRATIDQAIGILRSRSGTTADEALAALRAMSQAENRKLLVIAEHILDEAIRRARARHLRD